MFGPEMSSISESSEKRVEEGGFSVIRTVAGNCSNQILPRPTFWSGKKLKDAVYSIRAIQALGQSTQHNMALFCPSTTSKLCNRDSEYAKHRRDKMPLPTPFYNACYFPFLTDKGRELSQKLRHAGFKPSPDFDNAIIDILNGLQRIYPRPILTVHELEIGNEPFQASLIQDDEGNFVSAFRHSSSTIDITSDTVNDLSLEGAILASNPNQKYFLGCHYCFDKIDQRHLFRFTYVDRQSRFK